MEKKESKYITAEELNNIQEMNGELTKMKMALGELEMERHNLLSILDKMRARFSENEAKLIEKYGANAVINIKTGEVSEKSQPEFVN